jgi:hypothetical protein
VTDDLDIFARKPLPPSRAPSLRYDLFIKVVEKEVVAARARIEQLQKMERIYNLVKDVVEHVKPPNDTTIDCSSVSVIMRIQALPTDFLATFDPIINGIGKALVDAGFREEPDPSCYDGGYWHHLIRTWQIHPRMIQIMIDLPLEGLRDLEVVRTERQSLSYDYSVRKREPVTVIGHAPYRVVSEEIPF